MADIDETDLMLIELLQKDARTPQHELQNSLASPRPRSMSASASSASAA